MRESQSGELNKIRAYWEAWRAGELSDFIRRRQYGPDVGALLAEVERLTKENAQLRAGQRLAQTPLEAPRG